MSTESNPIQLPRQFLWHILHELPAALSIDLGPGVELPTYDTDIRFHATMTFLENVLLPLVFEHGLQTDIDQVLEVTTSFVLDPANNYPSDPEDDSVEDILMDAEFFLFPLKALGNLLARLDSQRSLSPQEIHLINQTISVLAEVNALSDADEDDDDPDSIDPPAWSSGPVNLN